MSVQGLKVQLSTDKLRGLVVGRVNYHTKKADFFEKEASTRSQDMIGFAEQVREIGKVSLQPLGGNIAEQMQNQSRYHRNLATYFAFLVENLIPDETYVLDETDLRRLEVI